jgi:SRSO17 transposase
MADWRRVWRWRLKDTRRGPLVWDVKHVPLVTKDDRGLPGAVLHLIVARSVLEPGDVKYFVSNASADAPLEELLLVAFSRWHVERCFEDQKTELGFDHFEGRSYLGLKRHQAVTAVSHLFLAQMQQRLRGKKSRAHRVLGASGRCGARSLVVAGRDGQARAALGRSRADRLLPTPQRYGASKPR